MTIVLQTEFQVGDIVSLKVDPDGEKFMILGFETIYITKEGVVEDYNLVTSNRFATRVVICPIECEKVFV